MNFETPLSKITLQSEWLSLRMPMAKNNNNKNPLVEMSGKRDPCIHLPKYKLDHPLRKSACISPRLKIEMLSVPAIPFLGIYQKDSKSSFRRTPTPMFTATKICNNSQDMESA